MTWSFLKLAMLDIVLHYNTYVLLTYPLVKMNVPAMQLESISISFVNMMILFYLKVFSYFV